jgi:Protein of unknown function (DUF1565)
MNPKVLRIPVFSAVAVLAIALPMAQSASASTTTTPSASATATATDLYVSPTGSDKAAGTTAQAPLKTIQAALNEAHPGLTIHLAPGTYAEDLTTKVSGTAAQPITIEGTDTGLNPAARTGTVLYGTSRIVSINNSYYHLQGFTIDGEQALATLGTTYPTNLADVAAFKRNVQSNVVDSTMIFIGAADSAHGITGTTINDMYLSHAGGDCVRMRGNANRNTISNTTITWCGMYGKYAGEAEYEFHNGEGVYIGTSDKSTDQSTYLDDNSYDNVVENSAISTFGSECFDVKENAHSNSFIDNTCADNDEPLSDFGSNLELRGYDNTVIGNTITDSLGYGLKMETDSGSFRQGGNVVENNTFARDTGSQIENKQTTAESTSCGNSFDTNPYASGQPVGTPTTACATAK